MAKSIVKIAPDINKYLRNVFNIQTIQDIAKLNALDLLLKQSLLGILVFYIQKYPRGANIHEIKESFPLKPSLVIASISKSLTT